jgi:hypothetical protein
MGQPTGTQNRYRVDKGECCFNHIIGLPRKDGIEKPLFDTSCYYTGPFSKNFLDYTYGLDSLVPAPYLCLLESLQLPGQFVYVLLPFEYTYRT